jgi:BlaI family transcriptional regulator, penicillinase repressor
VKPAAAVTEAEGALLEALWRFGPLSPPRLIAEVKAARPWGQATIKTLLARLMRKGAVRSERDAAGLRYRAVLEQGDYRKAEVQALAERLFDGDLAALAAFASAQAARRPLS